MQARIPDWYSLRGLARSGLGKASILFPILPFVVDLMKTGERVSEAAANAPAPAKNLAQEASTADTVVEASVDFWASALDAVSSFFSNNAGVLAGMYIGLGFFLAGKLLFEVAAPRSVRLHADAEAARDEILTLLNATTHPRVVHYLQAEFFKVESRIRGERWTNFPARSVCTGLFGLAALLLAGPALFKMIEMFGTWLQSAG